MTKKFLFFGFSHGFHIPYTGERSFRLAHNHKSCRDNPDFLHDHLQKETKAGRIVGPFSTPPFRNLQCSPLALIPKKDSDSFRLIHDLSFPEGASINDGISSEHTHVNYDNIDTVISLVKQFGKNAKMAKADILNAYRLVPIYPNDYELLGFTTTDKSGQIAYYFDTRLTMGLSISCQVFEKFSTALQWIMETKFGANMSHLLDDFFLHIFRDLHKLLRFTRKFFSFCVTR